MLLDKKTQQRRSNPNATGVPINDFLDRIERAAGDGQIDSDDDFNLNCEKLSERGIRVIGLSR